MKWLRWAVISAALVGVLAFYAWFQVRGFVTGYPETDPDGYFILAKRMAHHQPWAVHEPDPFLYQGHFWVDAADGSGVIPKFAPGYSMILSLFYRFGGDEGMFLASPVFGGLALLGLFALTRQWMSAAGALFTCAGFASCWMFEFYATYPLAHVVQLAFIVWGMAFLWRWVENPDPLVAIAAGLTLGAACTLRHSSAALAIVLLPAIAGMWWYRWELLPGRRLFTIASLLGAYAACPLLMAFYNRHFFGSFTATGYSLTGEQTALSVTNLVNNLPVIQRALGENLAIFIWPIGLVGLVAVGPWHSRLMRVAWFAAVFLLYGSYYYAPQHGGYYRFFLPLAPVLYAAAFLLIDRCNASCVARWTAMALLAGGVLYFNWGQVTDPAPSHRHSWYQKSNYVATAARVATSTLEPDAVIFAWPQGECHVGTRQRFSVYNLESFSREWGLKAFGPPQPNEPLMQESRRVRLLDLYTKSDDAALRAMRDQIMWRALAGNREVAWIIPTSKESLLGDTLPAALHTRLVGQWSQLNGQNWCIYQIVRR
ncbi:MAG: hypothetical protein K8S99_08365 [Planctomycetes bacterium]|nr:hypothetical protein [Planctomycetota bacterium]